MIRHEQQNCFTRSALPRRRNERRGSTLVLMAFAIVGILAFAAFAVDVGYLLMARNQLQNSADASAMAAAWALLDERRLQDDGAMYDVEWNARIEAYQYASGNKVAGLSPSVSLNLGNTPDGDVQFGRLAAGNIIDTGYSPEDFNAVRVLVRRTNDSNGEISLFFGRIFGRNTGAVQAEATAVFRDGITGFKSKSHVPFTSLLPFALKIDDWMAIESGNGNDNWEYDSVTGNVTAGGDGLAEGKMFPGSTSTGGNGNGNGNGNGGNGQGGNQVTSGNWGTVDIGAANNSTADLSRQIVEGVSSADLDLIGGELSIGDSLNGDTGISAGIKDELASIIGQERTIPLYDTVSGNGNNTNYHIVGFAGIRIVDVQLTGGNKYIMIQPAVVVDPSAIGTDTNTQSYQIFEPVVLIK